MQFSSKKCKFVIVKENGAFRSHQTCKAVIYAYADIICLLKFFKLFTLPTYKYSQWEVLMFANVWHITPADVLSNKSHPRFLRKILSKNVWLICRWLQYVGFQSKGISQQLKLPWKCCQPISYMVVLTLKLFSKELAELSLTSLTRTDSTDPLC